MNYMDLIFFLIQIVKHGFFKSMEGNNYLIKVRPSMTANTPEDS